MANSSANTSAPPATSSDGARIRASLASGGTDAAQIAAALIAICARIDIALSPIIGARGVAALCKRSLHIAAQTHLWLVGSNEDLQAALDHSTLRAAVAGQDSTEAAAGAQFLLQTFCVVLGQLVGDSLTERMLRSVWKDSP